MSKSIPCIAGLSFVILLLSWIPGFSSQKEQIHRTLMTRVGSIVEERIVQGENCLKSAQGEGLIRSSLMLERFYKKRDYQLAWSGVAGLFPQTDGLIKAIEGVQGEGLWPEDYSLTRIKAMREEIYKKQQNRELLNLNALIDFDVLLTDTFLMLGCHFSFGRVHPGEMGEEWLPKRIDDDIAFVLEEAIDTNQISETLRSLLPSQDGYSQLKRNLSRYRELDAMGGWPEVPTGGTLKKGDTDERIPRIKKRLTLSGDLPYGGNNESHSFNETLVEGVRKFQKCHGLKPDGIIGRTTFNALNVSVEDRIRQIELNLERLRWSNGDLSGRHILVNIADFNLEVVEQNNTVMSMRVVVGKPFWYTPVFKAKMTYLIFNPPWNVPQSIAVTNILPEIREKPGYLTKNGIKVLKGWGDKTTEIDQDSINWSVMSTDNFPYRLYQSPGPLNPLGRIKFMFPNKFNVYLHDSPKKREFKETVRTFSHGCIRIEKPLELAEYLLRRDPHWTKERIRSTIKKGKREGVSLPEPIAIHLLYFTAWVDENGAVHFRDDVYGRDNKLFEAFRNAPLPFCDFARSY